MNDDFDQPVTIWEMKDYIAIGPEGAPKYFFPKDTRLKSIQQQCLSAFYSSEFCGEYKIRHTLKDKTLQEYFNGE